MKKTIYCILATCAFTFTGSCGDFDINGDLDGMWHLRTERKLSDNTVTNVKEEFIYYSVLQDLITVKRMDKTENTGKYKPYIGRFIHTDDSLILYDFRIFQNEGIVATDNNLAPFYLEGTTSRYAIKKLNADEMVLRSEHRELTFKKF